MTESPEPRTEPTTVERTPPAYRDVPPDRTYYRHSRLNAVLAWVGIVAGIVFIVAVVFFSGFALGRHAGGGGWHGGGHHHHWQGMSHHGGPPMGQWRFPGGQGGPRGQMGPGGQTGPGGQQYGPGGGYGQGGQQFGPGGGYGQGGPQSPTTSPNATPHP